MYHHLAVVISYRVCLVHNIERMCLCTKPLFSLVVVSSMRSTHCTKPCLGFLFETTLQKKIYFMNVNNI